jgi:hypothetical protein
MSKPEPYEELDSISIYETAQGTGNAITVSIPSLVDGKSKTFVASANNNGTATTVNSKNLYKPNTTTAPNLIAGKAYTIWYNKSKDCFFIKASAEGNTVADHVLAGDTFSNDSDTGLIGNMDLKSENIKEGVTYAGITGTLHYKYDLSKALFNLPNGYPAVISPLLELDELWVSASTGQNTPILQFDDSGNIINTLNLLETERVLTISENYILTYDSSDSSPWYIRLYDKTGHLLNQATFTLVPAMSFIDEKHNRIILWDEQTGSYIRIYNLSLVEITNLSVDNQIRSMVVNDDYIVLIDGEVSNIYFIDNNNNITTKTSVGFLQRVF